MSAYSRAEETKQTDWAGTTLLQGHGLPVVRVEGVQGVPKANITWRNPPSAEDKATAEALMLEAFPGITFGHGV